MVRRVAFWLGASIAGLAAGGWLVGYGTVVYNSPRFSMLLSNGMLTLHVSMQGSASMYASQGWSVRGWISARPLLWPASLSTNSGTSLVMMNVPLWMPLVAGAGLAIACRRRRPAGSCRCGYDLLGLAEGVRCPECGAHRGTARG